ncbi:hypothetical protein ANO14919_003650 [Xylariales sp. No.14919]|nr:hypothetical protein ANO14919_003650 [Xylariales sp. No.14919]
MDQDALQIKVTQMVQEAPVAHLKMAVRLPPPARSLKNSGDRNGLCRGCLPQEDGQAFRLGIWGHLGLVWGYLLVVAVLP